MVIAWFRSQAWSHDAARNAYLLRMPQTHFPRIRFYIGCLHTQRFLNLKPKNCLFSVELQKSKSYCQIKIRTKYMCKLSYFFLTEEYNYKANSRNLVIKYLIDPIQILHFEILPSRDKRFASIRRCVSIVSSTLQRRTPSAGAPVTSFY